MHTQHHKNAAHLEGHDGHHGKVHICHKCGWPFPNPHPSSKHRRAHKRVCGKLDGYKLDDDDHHHHHDKTHLDGASDGEQHVSDDDDDFKTPSYKGFERTISRRSNSGVGSRSSRSTRSEDDVFADAATDFVDNPATDEAFGVVSRGNSLQNITENEPDVTELGRKDAVADNLDAPNILVKDTELQTVKTMEGENDKVEANMQMQDPITSSTNNLNTSLDGDKESMLPNQILEPRIMNTEITESDSGVPSALECSFVDSSGNIDSSLHSVQDVEDANGNVKADVDMVKGCDSKVQVNEDVHVLAVPDALPLYEKHSVEVVEAASGNAKPGADMVDECDSNENFSVQAVPSALPLQENPEIAVEDLDHKGGKFNILKTTDASLAVVSVENSTTDVMKESCSNTEFGPEERSSICSVDNESNSDYSMKNILEQEHEQKTVQEFNEISDVEASSIDVNEFRSEVFGDLKNGMWKDQKVGFSTEEPKFNDPLENFSPEVASVDRGDSQEKTANEGANTTANEGANTNANGEHDGQEFAVHRNIDKELVEESIISSSMVDAPAVDDIALKDTESNINYDEKVKVEATSLDENGMKNDDENKATSVRISSIARCDDKMDEQSELERSSELGKLDKILDSQPDTQGVGEIQNADEKIAEVEQSNKTSHFANAGDSEMIPKISGDAGSSFPSSVPVTDVSTERVTDNMSTAVEGDKIKKQHAGVSTADVVDSSSQTDSLEGNCGSISDLSPATDMAVSRPPQTSVEAVGKINKSLKPRIMPKEMEGASDASQNEPRLNPVTKTGQPTAVVDVENEAHRGKRNEEIIAKVNNWNIRTDEHHALKTLLGESISKIRAESSKPDKDSVPAPHLNETPKNINGLSEKNENLIQGFEEEPKEIGKEWNSPARYPVNIKTEKRAKSKPYWASFLCCSSVNAR